jgi:hypothetical protein
VAVLADFFGKFIDKFTGKELLALASIVAITLLGLALVLYPSDFEIFGYIMFLLAALGGVTLRDYRKRQRASLPSDS